MTKQVVLLCLLTCVLGLSTATAGGVWRTVADGNWSTDPIWSADGESGRVGPPPAGASIVVSHQVFTREALNLESTGGLQIATEGDLVIESGLTNAGLIANKGRLIIARNFRLAEKGKLLNANGASVAIEGDFEILTCYGMIYNAGYVLIQGGIQNHGVIDGSGGSYRVSGQAVNSDCSATFRGTISIYEKDGQLGNICGTVGPGVKVTRQDAITQVFVDLVFIELQSRANVLDLCWITAHEANSQQFVLERSRDGEKFKPIKSTEAANFSTRPVHYVMTDELPMSTLAFYRLKVVNMDEETMYSAVLVAKPSIALAQGTRSRQ